MARPSESDRTAGHRRARRRLPVPRRPGQARDVDGEPAPASPAGLDNATEAPAAEPAPAAPEGAEPSPASPNEAARTTLLIPPAILVAGWFLQPRWGWLAMMALLVAFIVLVGQHIAGPWQGALIDERK